MDENDCVAARLALQERGWSARVYGVLATDFVDALADIALENVFGGHGCTGVGSDAPASVTVPVVREGAGAANDFDLEGIELLRDMWKKRRLPRDDW